MPEAVDSASGILVFGRGSFCLAVLGGARKAAFLFYYALYA